MEFRSRRRPPLGATGGAGPGRSLGAPLYGLPPVGEATLEEFEAAAVERVRALRALETARGTGKGDRNARRDAALEALRRDGLKEYARSCLPAGPSDPAFRRRDELGHFALRLAHCGSEESRRWLLAGETELFRLRFAALDAEAAAERVRAEGVRCEPVPKEERPALEARLAECAPRGSAAAAAEHYRVAFQHALDAVAGRRAFLKDGLAHVPAEGLAGVAASRFRARLSEALAAASRALPRLEADARLIPLLRGIREADAAPAFASEGRPLPIGRIDEAAAASFPPCMRALHERLRREHHLRHHGRLQYGLFLKAAGVPLDDSMRFWRDEFCKLINADQFEKKYAYGVRYNYGKEGARKNFSAMSCSKIAGGTIGPGDAHGCPFRHCDPPSLQSLLSSYGIESQAAKEMAELSKAGQYGAACGKYFNTTHRNRLEVVIRHPNQYFEMSQKIAEGKYDMIPTEPSDDPQKSENPPEVQENNGWDEEFDISGIEDTENLP